jgi:hypothetical protein
MLAIGMAPRTRSKLTHRGSLGTVKQVLDGFRSRVRASTAAVLDGRRVSLPVVAETSFSPFWDGVDSLPCINFQLWGLARRALASGARESVCTCGGHFVGMFAIRRSILGRHWILAVVARKSLLRPPNESDLVVTVAESAVAQTIAALAKLLDEPDTDGTDPPPNDPRGGGGSAGPAELAIPLWWVRKPS